MSVSSSNLETTSPEESFSAPACGLCVCVCACMCVRVCVTVCVRIERKCVRVCVACVLLSEFDPSPCSVPDEECALGVEHGHTYAHTHAHTQVPPWVGDESSGNIDPKESRSWLATCGRKVKERKGNFLTRPLFFNKCRTHL